MTIRKVARLGHPVLRAPCRELGEDEIRSAEVRRLVEDMRETMHEYSGLGLAAPQVHESVRLAVVDLDLEGADLGRDLDTGPGPGPAFVPEPGSGRDGGRISFTLLNPRLTVLDPELEGHWEGCLSVPGMRGYVERPRRVRVDYRDETGARAQVTARGFLATVFQHELDHLDGVLYVDRLADPRLFSFDEEFGRYHAG